ncbi:hypothetical protein RJ639_029166 [Escallonia herrerae]|uniref:C2 NT-type domain-containing protein n=1 Tax=Escallonia herrerae TaxID=1293975 RepID=A0AA88X6M5_9ASTE|nr:hypothetical protein RJ639_029166 [Escallonia herrerae]
MVLGLRSKRRKGASVQVDYLVHLKEIKPWPPSLSLKSVQFVLLQWENGEQNTGSFISSVCDAKIELNESFSLPVTLSREKKANDKFQKNCLEIYLYEARNDKSAKGQLLGTAIINLADYGVIEEILTVSAPVNCKKSSKLTVQPILYVMIQQVDKDSSSSSPNVSISKEVSLDKDGHDSVSESINEQIDDESEIAYFTDDDVSSHPSRTAASSGFEAVVALPSQNAKDATAIESSTGRVNGESVLPLGVQRANNLVTASLKGSHTFSSIKSSFEPQRPLSNMMSIRDESVTPFVKASSSSIGYPDTNGESRNHLRSSEHESSGHTFHELIANSKGKIVESAQQSAKERTVERRASIVASHDAYVQGGVNSVIASSRDSQESQPKFLEGNTRKQGTLRSSTLISSRRVLEVQGTNVTSSKLKHMKSVQLPFQSAKVNDSSCSSQNMEKVKKTNNAEEAYKKITYDAATERQEPANGYSDNNIEWKSRVEMLEEELREAAAIEVGLYSIVAEHGSSINKVHTPARRISRFYFHACKARCQDKRAGAARAAVSGLVLVSKACGNDVPRLTFWLSNLIMLRAIVSQADGKMPLSGGPGTRGNVGARSDGRYPRRSDKSPSIGIEKNNTSPEFDDWEDHETFIIALENVEAWIFSRIVESVWWQTMTPHMQSTAAKTSGTRKRNASRYALGDQEQGNFSVELWKKAFKDSCERLCPIRAGGHECGCLHVLGRLVMEQLVSRLDVAMFNAILRESAEEMPTDPVSDPIGDPRVLPVPSGRSSFGAGAQLKNAIGNWSRWLTDLFGIEDNDSHEVDNYLGADNKGPEPDTSFKAFRLLNALSDLMMLPVEMLADKSTRKEVCPTLGAPLIKRVVNNFVPDEFCPHPIPDDVLEALDSEDALEAAGEFITSFPFIATPTTYSPPLAASLAGIIGELGSQALQRSGSSVLRKAYTSDDELDELDSPLTSIITENFRVSPNLRRPKWTPKQKGRLNVVRYRLLREVWRDGE